jgi:hypothetical protein
LFSVRIRSSRPGDPGGVLLCGPNSNEDFVHGEGVAVAPVLAPQSLRVLQSELIAPEASRFVSDDDSSPGRRSFDIPMGQIEPIMEPGVELDDLGRKSVTLALGNRGFHSRRAACPGLTWQCRRKTS